MFYLMHKLNFTLKMTAFTKMRHQRMRPCISSAFNTLSHVLSASHHGPILIVKISWNASWCLRSVPLHAPSSYCLTKTNHVWIWMKLVLGMNINWVMQTWFGSLWSKANYLNKWINIHPWTICPHNSRISSSSLAD